MVQFAIKQRDLVPQNVLHNDDIDNRNAFVIIHTMHYGGKQMTGMSTTSGVWEKLNSDWLT